MSLLYILTIGWIILSLFCCLVILFVFITKEPKRSIRTPFVILMLLTIIILLMNYGTSQVSIKCVNKICSVHQSFNNNNINFTFDDKPYTKCEIPMHFTRPDMDNSGLDLVLYNADNVPIFIGNSEIKKCMRISTQLNNYFLSDGTLPFKHAYDNNTIYFMLMLVAICYFMVALTSIIYPVNENILISNLEKLAPFLSKWSSFDVEEYAKEHGFYDDIICHGYANHFKSWESCGGYLYLTNSKLIFKSHKFNIQNHEFILDLSEITNIEPDSNSLFQNSIIIYTKNKSEKYVVRDREFWIEHIKSACSSVEKLPFNKQA